MELLLFLLQVFVISLSGALAPGPVTAAAIVFRLWLILAEVLWAAVAARW